MSRFRRTKKKSNRGNYAQNPNEKSSWSQKLANSAYGAKRREADRVEADAVDELFGYERMTSGPTRTGWLFNFRTTSTKDLETGDELSCLDLYFTEEDGSTFKASYIYQPYFLLFVKGGVNQKQEVESYLHRKFEGVITSVDVVEKIDLDMPNHLSVGPTHYTKVSFRNVQDLMNVRSVLKPIIEQNKKDQAALDAYGDGFHEGSGDKRKRERIMDNVTDIREYDVPYDQRVCIDCDVRVGKWYDVSVLKGTFGVNISVRKDLVAYPTLKIMAFDIETSKAPLKFPNAEVDAIIMISYMLGDQGYLIVNRQIVSADIHDFDYTPKPEYPGPFKIFNEKDEVSLLKRWFSHVKETRPQVYVTYNGDFFDWPFIETRAKHHGLDMFKEIGVWATRDGEYKGRFATHLDAYHWVKRDSYLPQGSQGLKAVTSKKLKYEPLELDPEDMLPFASEHPQILASYSVSDAVATYYLYMKYVHRFIFSLGTIIPMPPSDVLRKGSGTLCELLLMVQAFEGNIVCPNKQREKHTKFHKGHLLESETYIGGHVESLESGIFRSDIPYKFRMNPEGVQKLLDNLERSVKFTLEEEENTPLEDCLNVDEVVADIRKKLESLRDQPNIECLPMIYHLDVGAMYPNIILTNRLQPMATVDQATCAACDFNRPGKTCQRKMEWSWRGKNFPATRSEYEVIKSQLEYETVKEDPNRFGGPAKAFSDLRENEQAELIQARVKSYSHKVYGKYTNTSVESRDATICQRENPFYVDTVRAFRDRRYTYKGLTKKWSRDLKEATSALEKVKAKDMVLLYDSMQLAHKCILNSFYGYVMRKGARWHSIEMAGVVTKTGADIIKDARMLVEDIGRPLELDTDGIWCIIPSTFPENYKIHTKKSQAGEGRPIIYSYACSILNLQVNDRNTNFQYQTLVDPAKQRYKTEKQCTIYFEVDGPYKAMVLPASKDEGKTIKKRYAVFNMDGSLAELKGFEIKRRGELKLIKIFQGQVFKAVLNGNTLQTVYDSVAAVCDHWLDVLYSEGAELEDDDIFELVGESKNMAQALADYGNARSTAITTAKRLGEFLGMEMVKDKGLCCRFIVAKRPLGASVSDRAVPVAIFAAEPAIMKHYLRKWLKDSGMQDFDIRGIIDWEYYITRLGSAIQKIITIPAAFQKIKNPVPRVKHPEWLAKRVRELDSAHTQSKLTGFFSKKQASDGMMDMEDMLSQASSFRSPLKQRFARVKKRRTPIKMQLEGAADGEDAGSAEHAEMDGVELEQKDEEAAAAAAEQQQREEEEKCPDQETDLIGWLQYQKKQWSKQLSRRRELKEEATRLGIEAPLPSVANGLRGYLAGADVQMQTKYWQIVQVVPESAGRFKLWAFVGNTLQHVTVSVPRVVYVNTRSGNSIGADIGRRVQRLLPRGRPCLNLYEMEMSEEDFLANSKDMHTLLTNPGVEGVYETQVPLLFKMMVDVGCVVRAKGQPEPGNEYSLNQLSYKTTSECPYLVDIHCEKVFLYHSKSGSRGVFGIFVPSKRAAQVFVANPGNDGGLEQVNLRALFRACDKALYDQVAAQLAEDGEEAGEFEHDPMEFRTHTVRNLDQLYERVGRALETIKEESTQPTVLVSQCRDGLAGLYVNVPIIKSNFPVVSLSLNEKDNAYPALGWYSHACKRMAQRFLQSDDQWQSLRAFCSQTHIPIGNLNHQDMVSDASDILYARALRENDHLLWLSAGPRPDLGGFEEDENFFEDEHTNPEVVSPGCFRTISVEMELRHVAVNSVLQQAYIEELEGGMGLRQVAGESDQLANMGGAGVEGTYACRNAFRILKSLLTTWFHVAQANQDMVCENLLQHFYRWIRSPGSKMYDPALHSMVHKMMKKVLMQLLARFRKLGSTVVHASFTKITIASSKPTFERALAYTAYIVDTIKSKPLFQWLQLDIIAMWENLIFMDAANYGGIMCDRDLEAELLRLQTDEMQGNVPVEQPEDESGQEDEDKEPMIISNWNIADYLPDLANEAFQAVVAEFFAMPYKYKREQRRVHPSQSMSQASTYVTPEARQAQFAAWLKDNINTHMNRKLFSYASKIRDVHAGDERAGDNAASDFPVLAGSHLPLHNPALEFIKSITHVLSLDPVIEDEVRRLRTNLMKIVEVKAFSAGAQFHNPCLTFKLPDVICSFCNTCRDLDLCRDPDLLEHNFACAECDSPYDRSVIEASLVDIVLRRSVTYQVQDVSCVSCGKVKQSNMSKYCTCSGVFRNTLTPKDFRKSMRPFRNIAAYHSFPWLQETVQWVLQGR